MLQSIPSQCYFHAASPSQACFLLVQVARAIPCSNPTWTFTLLCLHRLSQPRKWIKWCEWLQQCTNIANHIVDFASLPPAKHIYVNDWGSFSLTATHSIAIPAHCSGHTASNTQINWFVWFEWLEQCSNISHHIVVFAPLPPARQSDLNHPKWPEQFRAVHHHDPSHRCVRTASPSQANWFSWSKWLKQYTNMNHHIVAFAPLPPASNNFC